MTDLPHLDILLYAHDGRGLGHVSRTIAIGMALRRLYPELRVLLVSGAEQCRELIGPARLDWIKLPAYRTRIREHRSCGIDGWSGYTDQELGVLRAELLKRHILALKPRLVLCDHSPQGKHRELLPAIEAARSLGTRWILGIRGVVGSVPQVHSTLARDLVKDRFSGILWYGDSQVLGTKHCEHLAHHLGNHPLECGYVSRLREILALSATPSCSLPRERTVACTVSLPWLGPASEPVLDALVQLVRQTEPGMIHCYLPSGGEYAPPGKVIQQLQALAGVRVREIGPAYIHSLLQSKSAIIYGGYNSITDILAARIPSVVLMRSLRDREQEEHLELLCKALPGHFQVLAEDQVTPERLRRSLAECRENQHPEVAINLDGAEHAANHLADILS